MPVQFGIQQCVFVFPSRKGPIRLFGQEVMPTLAVR